MKITDDMKDLYTKDELMKLGIYELRKLGQDIGVVSPTSLKKEVLVSKILAVLYGEVEPRKIGKGRGRPSKHNPKTSKLYINLIEKLDEPNSRDYIYTSSDLDINNDFMGMVAAPRVEYMSESQDENSVLKRGVVCEENGKWLVRKLRFIHSENDHILPDQLASDYGVKDCDMIEYFLDESGKNVSRIIKINGNFASRIGSMKSKRYSEEVLIGDAVLKTNESNVICAPSSRERRDLAELVAKKFSTLGNSVVCVHFDSYKPKEKEELNINRSDFYCSGVSDEYETIAVVEASIERARLFASMEQNAVLIIDNLGWLMSVVDTFPKFLYGNFINKLGRLSGDRHLSITVICIASDLSSADVKQLSGMFDNVYLNAPIE